ncbi:ubiquitin-associated protein 2 isoform X5 [Xenopus laevis]|uniref:Ubiquitin-associated protein 2 isoform X5 n=1 Tax=Xenopus laevis TaxID=8355 RepID=A0A8J0UB64_XENLA|nr:ubiquitin-associated protein 2 isoform X5 [Xenopus laevis]
MTSCLGGSPRGRVTSISPREGARSRDGRPLLLLPPLLLLCEAHCAADFLFCTYIVLYILYMMTSVGNERTRVTREKPPISTPQTQTQKQVQVQATAEQIRLAQMIYDKNDADFEDKVKQLMEVTGKNQDECIVALHDCNGDVNRAINILLEGNSDTTSWETVGGKKKSIGKESSENKENRERRSDREMSRGRGSSSRRGRGGSRGREFRSEENGVDIGPGDRPSDRGRRGRGRGFGGRGRGRGSGRFSAQGMGTFNPADYTESAANDGKTEVWETGQNDGYDGTEISSSPFVPPVKGAWRNSLEEWTTEDWNEDLSETKVFTASSVPTENHITPGQSTDLVALLQKQPSSTETDTVTFEASQQKNFGQALVFTNSQHSSQITSVATTSNAVNSYSPQSLSSVLGSGFGELGSSKLANSPGSQILEQLKSPGLGQFTNSNSQQSSTSTAVTSSWDIKPTGPQSSVLGQFDFKTQPEPSPVLSQLSQRPQHQPPPGLESFSPQVKLRETSPVDISNAVGKMLQLPNLSLDPLTISTQQTQQQKQLKPQKRRIPPTSKVGIQKIPASAVEMPGSADVSGLNVQFGALEFGSEPSLTEFGSNSSPDHTSQKSNHLYSTTIGDSLSASLPISSGVQEPSYTPTVIATSNLSSSSQSTSPVTTTSSSSSSYEQTSVHSRIAYQSSVPPAEVLPVANGHNGIRAQTALSTTPSVQPVKPEISPPSLSSVGSLPNTVPTTSSLLPSTSQHASVTLSSLPQPSDLSSTPLSQLNSTLSGHQNSLPAASVLSSSASHLTNSVCNLQHTSVENTVQPTTTFSTASTSATSTTSSGISIASTMNSSNTLGLGAPSVSMPAATTRTAPLVTSGKAPPNLPQGVPPLLHNQYIVGPGGLLPAYPQIYGYDDLQMLQSRLPMDYYGITFPAPATLTGRDGGLASNPYSGDVAKFGRGDSASPAPATTLAQPQQNQTQTHHTAQQPFLNPTLPPGYSYTGLPYYAGVPGVPSAFQYGPTMFVPPASAKQHGVNLNTASTPFQQAGGYGQHGYGAGYDDLTQGTAAGDYSKGGYGGSSQAQSKSAGAGPGKGVSVSSSNMGVPDISGSVYNKTQTFDKQGFHTATPPPFSLPSALASTGPLNPGAAAGYAPAPFLHILPAHQQPHSQLLHHHLQQDGQGVSAQRNQPNPMQQKSQANKTAYASSPYWTN